MEFIEYAEAIHKAIKGDKPQHWRVGQAAFNMLEANRYDLADKVRGTMIDPFLW